jgi:nitrite reductase/ring-hydroxylating ferredoxin subunit
VKISFGQLASLERGEFDGILRACSPSAHVGIAICEDRLFAFDSQCPHRAADLTIFGQLTGDCSLRCGVHGHVYDLETGTCSDARDCDPKLERLIVLAAGLDLEDLWVQLPDDE